MQYDIFFSICQVPVAGHTPSEAQMFRNFFDQIEAADQLGYGIGWVAESHLSSQVQKRTLQPVVPFWEGEIGLNVDILQLAAQVFARTRRIEVGSAIMNILCNGGPVAHAERIAAFLGLHGLDPLEKRRIHIGFAAGRFDFMNRAYGIGPRNPLEQATWGVVKGQLFRQAAEIFVRLIRGDELASADVAPIVLRREMFRTPADWERARELAAGADTQPPTSASDSIPVDPFYVFEILKIVPQDFRKDLLNLVVGSHDPVVQEELNRLLPIQVFNLSITKRDVIEDTHRRMTAAYHPNGGPWHRGYMPRTVFVFLNEQPGLSKEARRAAAREEAREALSAYWTALEGTIDPKKVSEAADNALVGDAEEVAEQALERFHADDRLMLWFDFFNHDSERVIANMAAFHAQVIPRIERALGEVLVKVLYNHVRGVDVPAASGATLVDIEPATGQPLATIPESGPADVDAAVQAARDALHGPWGSWTAGERADLCDAVADVIEDRIDELSELEARDTGKPVSTARTMDIPRAVANFRFFAGAVRHQETGCHEMSDALNYTLRRPLGVVALITPWNLPLYLLSWKAAPALATGNTVVAKPSELTPLTASALASILTELGAPPGVFNLLHGTGPSVGAPLVAHRGIDGVSFTGGTATGARVAAAAAPQFKKLSLELGGKNATVVFADADFDAAVAGAARAGFTNAGQICLCGSRILVERPIHDRFVQALVERVTAMRQGDPLDRDTAVGALISAAHRDKVEGYLALARDEGGTVVCGGRRPELPSTLAEGFFLQPTVVTGLRSSCRTATEEIFGPVVTVHPFDGDEEALGFANGVRYGLSASIWTRDLGRAHRFSAGLEVGMVWVNTWLKRDLRVPFGGLKDSGVGREGGSYSLSFYTEDKNVCVQL